MNSLSTLSVGGNGISGVGIYDNGNITGVLRYGGSYDFYSPHNTYGSGSDERIKKNITSINPSNALQKIMELNPVTFNWKDNTTGLQEGLIAQEVQKVFPNIVSVGAPTNYTPNGKLSITYNSFIAPMISAMQQQQKIII